MQKADSALAPSRCRTDSSANLTHNRPMPKTRYLLASAALLLLALAAWLWLPRGTPVEVALVRQTDLTQTVVMSGRIASAARSQIASQTTARIEQVLVREGDPVRAGQVLVRLRDEEAQAALAQADAAVAEARAALRRLQTVQSPMADEQLAQARAVQQQAQQELGRARDLLDRGFVSQSRVDDAVRQAASAQAAWQAAQAQARGSQADGADASLAQARLQQALAAQTAARTRADQQVLRALADGTLIQRSADPGDTAQPGRVLLVVAHGQPTRIEAHVDEKNLRFLQLGQSAVASADAYPDQRFQARVDTLAPAIDPQRGTVEVQLVVTDPPATLRTDMTVSVEVVTGRVPAALVLPADALRRDSSGNPYVLVIRGGTAERVEVETGLVATGAVQIRKGVQAGDSVILSGSTVAEGQRVREQARRAPRANVPSMPGFTS